MTPATVSLDRSDTRAGLHLTVDGRRVDLEYAFEQGLIVTPEDMPAVATMLANFLTARDEHSK